MNKPVKPYDPIVDIRLSELKFYFYQNLLMNILSVNGIRETEIWKISEKQAKEDFKDAWNLWYKDTENEIEED